MSAIKCSCLCLALLLLATGALAGQEIRILETRSNVTLKILLLRPEKNSGQVLVMLPGGKGAKHFGEKNGTIQFGKNFLVRTAPDFVGKGLAVAVVDTPSDQKLGMDDSFRVSSSHRDDIDKVILFLVGQGYESIFLVGTSRGTISAAYLGAVLQRKQIKGLVLTSTMSYAKYLAWTSLEKTTCPVLLIHHLNDGCAITSYADALTLKEKYSNSPRVDFITMEGGLSSQSDPCGPLSSHGFLGIEDKVVQAIHDWIRGIAASKPIPSD
jgi:hypothetical protein